MKKSYFFPVTLIVIGTLLLLNQFDLLELSRPFVFVLVLSLILGAVLIRKALLTPSRKGILGGSFFILLAIGLLLMDFDYIPKDDILVFPMLLIPLGLANLIYFSFNRSSFTNVTFGIVFILASLPILIFYYGSIPYWEISDTISTYWPVLLITAGLGFLIEGVLKKAK
jgi:hypothetical protein